MDIYKQKRTPDTQYQDLLKSILEHGERMETQMDVATRKLIGAQLRYELANGFPLITERDLLTGMDQTPPADPKARRRVTGPAKQGLGEILGFINGARTLDQLAEFGNKWWKFWATKEKCEKRGLEEGDLGPGSYGAAFHDFPTSEGPTFNQIKHVVEQIKEMPQLRTHIVTPFIPQYIGRGKGKQQKVVVVPCHGLMHFHVNGDELSLLHWQRSADMPVGVPFNLIHYGAMLLMVAQVTGLKPKALVYQFSDAHIYETQLDLVKEIVSRQPRPFPKVYLDPSVKNIEDFRVEHFSVEDYDPHPPMKLPTPV